MASSPCASSRACTGPPCVFSPSPSLIPWPWAPNPVACGTHHTRFQPCTCGPQLSGSHSIRRSPGSVLTLVHWLVLCGDSWQDATKGLQPILLIFRGRGVVTPWLLPCPPFPPPHQENLASTANLRHYFTGGFRIKMEEDASMCGPRKPSIFCFGYSLTNSLALPASKRRICKHLAHCLGRPALALPLLYCRCGCTGCVWYASPVSWRMESRQIPGSGLCKES